MLKSVKDALNALLLNHQVAALRQSDATFASLCAQLEAYDALLEDLAITTDEEQKAYAVVSFYLFLWYLNQHHAAILATVAKGYLRLR